MGNERDVDVNVSAGDMSFLFFFFSFLSKCEQPRFINSNNVLPLLIIIFTFIIIPPEPTRKRSPTSTQLNLASDCIHISRARVLDSHETQLLPFLVQVRHLVFKERIFFCLCNHVGRWCSRFILTDFFHLFIYVFVLATKYKSNATIVI